MKKFSSALIALGLSVGVLSAQADNMISVPQLAGGFFMGLSALYLQPSPTNGDLDDGILGSTILTHSQNIEPNFRWGWGIDAGYIFPQTANDIAIKFWQLNAAGGNNYTQEDTETGLFTTVAGKASYHINQIDLTIGQLMQIGSRLSMHSTAGLQWLQVERQFAVTTTMPFFLVETPVIDTESINLKSQFNGIGPEIGTQAQYYLGDGFAFLAEGDAALLIGNINTDYNRLDDNYTLIPEGEILHETAYIANRAGDTRRIVPEWNAKLGGIYTYWYNSSCQRGVSLEGGWQFTHYYNVIDNISPVASFTGGTIPHQTSDLAVQGPYISLTAHL